MALITDFISQIRNVGTGLCVDTKHGALGSPLRAETCVKGKGEAAWSNVQVSAFFKMNLIYVSIYAQSTLQGCCGENWRKKY